MHFRCESFNQVSYQSKCISISLKYSTAYCQNAFLFVVCAVTVDCGKNSVSVRWINVNSQVDPSLLRLGDCPPTQLSVNPQGSEAVFYAEFLTCNIRRLVSSVKNFTVIPSTPIYYPVACAYEREEDWAPPLYDPLLFHTHGQGDLAFRMALMKDDFSGVATTTTFSLGSMIPIAASVAQQNHQPLILLLDECLASTTPELAPDSHVYPLITNKGYVCRQDVPFLKPKMFPCDYSVTPALIRGQVERPFTTLQLQVNYSDNRHS
uniref:Zona pellucida glycoprotein 3f, tandem duplicate 1 n=1 Tax=Sinocyclocheilus rhinocerous TaxID=307959 RepID=A0A673IJX6_9TELE